MRIQRILQIKNQRLIRLRRWFRQLLEEQNIFTLALARGIRASVASMSMEKCVKAAKAIAAMINEK